MADASDSKSDGGNLVPVQVRPPASLAGAKSPGNLVITWFPGLFHFIKDHNKKSRYPHSYPALISYGLHTLHAEYPFDIRLLLLSDESLRFAVGKEPQDGLWNFLVFVFST